MKLSNWFAVAATIIPALVLAQAALPTPFALGDVFIDRNGDTLQIVQCQGAGWQAECKVRRIAESGNAPIDPTNRWWTVDTLRGSQERWISDGGAPYAGPAVPLPGAGAAVPAQPGRTMRAQPAFAPAVADDTPAAPAMGGTCARSNYGGPVPGNRQASAALFRQKITDSITMGNTPRGWYGVQLTNFQVGGAIRNTVGRLPGGGVSRVNNGAPVGAIMYPVSTTMSVCEAWNGGSNPPYTSNKKYLCFVSANNEWTCGASN